MFLNNTNYIIKDISHFNLFKVKYIIINKEFFFCDTVALLPWRASI